MRTISVFTVAVALLLAGCGGDDAPKKAAPPRLDASSPRALAQSLIAIARFGNLAALNGIAAPDVATAEAKRVGELATASPEEQREFRTTYAAGSVTGDKVHGDEADVDIRVGLEGKKGAKLKLVKIGDRWYLQAL